MNSSDRAGETGVPATSLLAARESFVTLSQPSVSPRFFQRLFSNSVTSFGRTRLTNLSPTNSAAFTTIALTALSTMPRVAGAWRTGTMNRACDGPRALRATWTTGGWIVSAPEGWRTTRMATLPGSTAQFRSRVPPPVGSPRVGAGSRSTSSAIWDSAVRNSAGRPGSRPSATPALRVTGRTRQPVEFNCKGVGIRQIVKGRQQVGDAYYTPVALCRSLSRCGVRLQSLRYVRTWLAVQALGLTFHSRDA